MNMYNEQTINPGEKDESFVKMIKVNKVELALNKMLELFTEKSFKTLIIEAKSLIFTILNTKSVEIW